ncbi:unnamed protein product [Knipowitschia caucasica]
MVVAKMTAAGGVRGTATQQMTNTALNPVVQSCPSPAPGRTVVITVPRAPTSQPVTPAPRVQTTTTTQLPANFQIPPGMMLIRSSSGQLMMVSQQALAQAQQAASRPNTGPPTPTVLTPPPTPSVSQSKDKVTMIRMAAPPNYQSSPMQKTALVKVVGVPPKALIAQPPIQTRILTSVTEPKKAATPAFSQETLESVKKCKNFLVTLIKLASSDSRSEIMANNVRGLVKILLEGKLDAEEFTEKLYCELKSTPQPCLVPFLKKSLPAVRVLTPDPQLFIQQASCKATLVPKSATDNAKQMMPPPRPGQAWLSQPQSKLVPKTTGLQSARNYTGKLPMRECYEQPHQTSKSVAGTYKEDDDINDVASMAGVNLREENARILTTQVGAVVQSCHDQPFLAPNALLTKLLQMGKLVGVNEVGPEVGALVSHATQEFLRTLLEKLSVMAQHRKNLVKDDWFYSKVSDVRSQLKFLEDVETLRKKRKDEEERERMLRLARRRCHFEDPEMILLKQRAKELQLLEQAELQQREANLAALAAIGPRKKRPLELDGQVCVLPRPSIPRVTRIILRDLVQCMEQDRLLRHSLTLYRAML